MSDRIYSRELGNCHIDIERNSVSLLRRKEMKSEACKTFLMGNPG